MRFIKSNNQQRCAVCRKVRRMAFIIKDQPPLDGLYCSVRCIEKAEDNIKKIEAGRTDQVAEELGIQRGEVD